MQNFIRKFIFCIKIFEQKSFINRKNIKWRLSATNALQSIAQALLRCHTMDVRPEKYDLGILSLWENPGPLLLWWKTCRQKSFVHQVGEVGRCPSSEATSRWILHICLWKMIFKAKIRSGQWGMSKAVRQNLKKSALPFIRNWPRNFLSKMYCNTPLNWLVLHRLMQKSQHLQALCTDRKKIHFFL